MVMLYLLANDTDPCIWCPPKNMKPFVGGVLTEWDWKKREEQKAHAFIPSAVLLETWEQHI